MTSQAVEGMWIRSGGYGQLRGEFVERIDALQAVNQKHICWMDDSIFYCVYLLYHYIG